MNDPTTDESRQKYRNKWVGLALGTGLLIVGGWIVLQGIVGITDNEQPLFAPDGRITIEIVDTPEDRALGLSGRASIADDRGMLFVFDDVSEGHCFWMKDMQFSIDMVWLDQDKNVVTVTPDVAPQTFPNSFCPESAARYGLELGSGRAAALGITPGERLRF